MRGFGLKSLETFEFETIFIVMPKNTIKAKKKQS